MAQKTKKYILKWSRMLCKKVKYFGFEPEDGSQPQYVPGQFITLHIQDPSKPKILHRSYSIANVPHQNKELEIACSFVEGGVASNLLFNLKPGDVIEASGPVGLFVMKKEELPARYIFVATGTGVAPYRSMLDEIHKRLESNPKLKVTILLGVRSAEELLFAEEFLEFSKNRNNFEFKACLSRETDQYAYRHFEEKGHVQHLFPKLNLNPLEDLVYLCGNPNMIDDAYNLLIAQGFDRKSIRREKYLFSH